MTKVTAWLRCGVVALTTLGLACSGDSADSTPAADAGADSATEEPTDTGPDGGPQGAQDGGEALDGAAAQDTGAIADGGTIPDGDGATTPDAQRDAGREPPVDAGPIERRPIQLGLMVHLEGWDLSEEGVYRRYVTIVEELATLFDTYDAKLTLETRIVAPACVAHGDGDSCILTALEARGHGVGVHADIGGNPPPGYTLELFSADLVRMATEMREVGATVRHASGICSDMDWVKGVHDAGLLFATGIVEYCALSLSDALLPEEQRDCQTPATCHGPFPTDLLDRLHPWRARSGSEWTLPGPNGPLVIMPEIGGLKQMQEGFAGGGGGEFNQQDIDTFEAVLDDALARRRPGRPAAFYLGLSIGARPDMALLEAWLQAAQPYVQAGDVEWATLPEMYDAFIAWEARRQ